MWFQRLSVLTRRDFWEEAATLQGVDYVVELIHVLQHIRQNAASKMSRNGVREWDWSISWRSRYAVAKLSILTAIENRRVSSEDGNDEPYAPRYEFRGSQTTLQRPETSLKQLPPGEARASLGGVYMFSIYSHWIYKRDWNIILSIVNTPKRMPIS